MTMTYDTWDLETLRQAAAFNIANPDPAEQDAIDWVNAKLAEAEAQRPHVTAQPVADEEPARRPQGNGYSNYGGQVATGPSEAQERYIRTLCAERGLDADAILDGLTKAKASKEIDRIKKLPRQQAVRPATPCQLEFLQDLLTERVHEYTVDGDPSFDKASEMITALLDAPKLKAPAHGIRHGRYAYQPEGAQAQFYRVAQDGRIYIQAGPAEHPYRGTLNEALEAIKADTKTHAALYGQLIGRCGRCGLELTDEVSRAQGLGPICIGKSDW